MIATLPLHLVHCFRCLHCPQQCRRCRSHTALPLLGPSQLPTGTPPQRREGGGLSRSRRDWCERQAHIGARGGRKERVGLGEVRQKQSLWREAGWKITPNRGEKNG